MSPRSPSPCIAGCSVTTPRAPTPTGPVVLLTPLRHGVGLPFSHSGHPVLPPTPLANPTPHSHLAHTHLSAGSCPLLPHLSFVSPSFILRALAAGTTTPAATGASCGSTWPAFRTPLPTAPRATEGPADSPPRTSRRSLPGWKCSTAAQGEAEWIYESSYVRLNLLELGGGALPIALGKRAGDIDLGFEMAGGAMAVYSSFVEMAGGAMAVYSSFVVLVASSVGEVAKTLRA